MREHQTYHRCFLDGVLPEELPPEAINPNSKPETLNPEPAHLTVY